MWSYLQGVCINGALDHEERITCDQAFLPPLFSGKSDGQGRGREEYQASFSSRLPAIDKAKKNRLIHG